MALLSVEPQCNFCRATAQAESGFGWWWAALVVDRAQEGARAKDGAVA